MEDDNSIKIPIKDIVENAVNQNGCNYPEDEFNLIRKYFIACLNLGYLEPKDLVEMVNKFCLKIKFITTNFNGVNKLDYYAINNNVLYLNGMIKDNNYEIYEINYYKAISEVVFNISQKYSAIGNAICEMAAEKIYNMDTNESRIIMPVTVNEVIEGKTIQLRAGYKNYNLVINLLKQFFICKGINENKLIRDMFFNGYDKVIDDNIKDSNDKLLCDILDKIHLIMLNRIKNKQVFQGEKNLQDKYQIIVNSMFNNIDQNYLAFCALITTDELREKCMSQMESKLDKGDKHE